MTTPQSSVPHTPALKTALITGTSRGIGLALAQEFLRRRYNVIATARNAEGCRDLWELERDHAGRCRIMNLDVTNDADLRALSAKLAGEHIDVLINNAGVLPEVDAPFASITIDGLLKGFTVNTIGPIRVTQTLLKNLEAAPQPVVATLTSKMGSIADNTAGGAYAYRISKAAVNMWNKTFAMDHKQMTAVVLHPGWVQTDMGGTRAPTTVDESVTGLASVITGLKREDSGRFFDYLGRDIAW